MSFMFSQDLQYHQTAPWSHLTTIIKQIEADRDKPPLLIVPSDTLASIPSNSTFDESVKRSSFTSGTKKGNKGVKWQAPTQNEPPDPKTPSGSRKGVQDLCQTIPTITTEYHSLCLNDTDYAYALHPITTNHAGVSLDTMTLGDMLSKTSPKRLNR